MILENLPVVFYVVGGRAGSYYFQSLMDSHEEILLLPPFGIYRPWKTIGADHASNPDDMFDRLKEYFENSVMGERDQAGERSPGFTENQKDIFYNRLKSSLIERGISRQMFFWAIHEAYAEAAEIDTSKLKVVVVHEHIPFCLSKIIKDFPKARILFLMRNLKAAIAGALRYCENYWGEEGTSDYLLNMIFEQWWQVQEFLAEHGELMGEDIRCVKNEDLNGDVEAEMKKLSVWLGIEYSESLTKSTMSGKPWKTETSYVPKGHTLKRGEYYEAPDLGKYYSKGQVESRWKGQLTFSQTVMVESFYRDLMIKNNYFCRTSRNPFWKLYGLIVFLLPWKDQLRRWWRTYPEIVEFGKISVILGRRSAFAKRVWTMIPQFLKMAIFFLYSVGLRFQIYFFPGDRGSRYF